MKLSKGTLNSDGGTVVLSERKTGAEKSDKHLLCLPP